MKDQRWRKRNVWDRLKWVITDWTRYDANRARERQRHFVLMTGLHGTYWFGGKTLTPEEIIAIQARKIKGLEMQRTQLTKGFTRKITKLQHELRMLTKADPQPCQQAASAAATKEASGQSRQEGKQP